jgi:hypothetical protein
MTDTMRQCTDWMMGLGPLGMALAFLLVVALLVLVAVLVGRAWGGSRR